MVEIAETSRFHWLLANDRASKRHLWDTELFASQSFVVVPSLGALVPGWLLIVPRRPMLSLRDLTRDEQQELNLLINQVAAVQIAFGGEVFAFEHGSSYLGSLMGCGVDQAHLHLVPLDFDLVESAQLASDANLDWLAFGKMLLTDLPRTGEYIALWQVNNGQGAVATVQNPVSQWMRRHIGQRLGVGLDWNYRTSPQLENIQTTVDVIRRVKSLTK